jgi:hypothetical protein
MFLRPTMCRAPFTSGQIESCCSLYARNCVLLQNHIGKLWPDPKPKRSLLSVIRWNVDMGTRSKSAKKGSNSYSRGVCGFQRVSGANHMFLFQVGIPKGKGSDVLTMPGCRSKVIAIFIVTMHEV